jgi:rod shape-determining protein MreC
VVASPRRAPDRRRLTLLLLVMASVTLLVIGGDSGPIGAVRSGVAGVLAPVGGALDGVTRPLRDAWSGAFGSDDLRAENERLAQRVAELEQSQAGAESARRELEALAADLDLEVLSQIDSVVARVVGGPAANFDRSVQIDRGSASGIREGMPVVGGGGLVGRVVAVTANRSTVQPISDAGVQVGVRVAGGTGLGVVSGQGSEVRGLASSFDRATSITEGDLLVTSGAARSLYPPDLAVATVASVTVDAVGLEKEAQVDYLAGLSELRYLTVLLWEPPE